MGITTFQRVSSINDPTKVCQYVTNYYLENHEATKQTYEHLSKERKVIFEKTYEKAMEVSLSVLKKNNADFYLATDESNKIVGFTMGMPYRPSISPLTQEFFEETEKECPEFREIFTETMPLGYKYGTIKDADLESVLDGKEVYYLGMASFEDDGVLSGLVDEVSRHVF